MLSDDNLPALQITIHATTSNDLPTVLHALNTHHLTTDYTADDTHPLTDLQPGHTYVTRAGADTAEHLATTLITTAPHTVFELVNDPHETQEGTYIGHVPGTGTYRAQCNADGDPLVPADALAQALANAPPHPLGRDVARRRRPEPPRHPHPHSPAHIHRPRAVPVLSPHHAPRHRRTTRLPRLPGTPPPDPPTTGCRPHDHP